MPGPMIAHRASPNTGVSCVSIPGSRVQVMLFAHCRYHPSGLYNEKVVRPDPSGDTLVEEDGMSGELVLVTGGSGFIGAHCILQLLRAGYRVRTTVRSLAREADVRAMLKAGGAIAARGDPPGHCPRAWQERQSGHPELAATERCARDSHSRDHERAPCPGERRGAHLDSLRRGVCDH